MPDIPKNKVILGIASILFLAVIWAGQFYYKHLRGIWPAVLPAPSVSVSQTPEPTGTVVPPAQNTTGIPLVLPGGFSVSTFADGLPNARVIKFDSSGNAWVSQPKEGMVTMLEIKDGKVIKQNAVFKNLRRPHGLAFDPDNKNILYIAEEHRVVRAHLYSDAPLEKVIDLPTGGNHTSRTIDFGPDGRLYISVGSTCNVCNESDWRRAKILVVNKDGTGLKEYAKGLRNSVFFAWHPGTQEMWATEMGRDLLGDNIPPDEVNIVREGQNYGWPICYGQNIHDTNFDKNTYIRNPCQEPFELPSLIDIPAHSAPLGLVFVPANSNWPAEYRNNLLVAYHGSWNRTTPTGYKVVSFSSDGDGYAQKDFITGWFPAGGKGTSAALGRPVELVFYGNALYITDDKAGVVYRVTYSGSPAVSKPSPKTSSNECVTGGCSGELCLEADKASDIASICIWREEFACYNKAKCERQPGGRCGWTMTEELRSCLDRVI